MEVEEPQDTPSSTVVYRINYCQFLLAFRNAEIKRYVCNKYKDVSGRLVELMLETGQRLNDKHNVVSLPKTTSPIARSFLCDRLDTSVERIEAHLNLLMKVATPIRLIHPSSIPDGLKYPETSATLSSSPTRICAQLPP